MTRKSTATKTTATKSSTQTTTRKSTAARTKLPAVAVVETPVVVETVVVETVVVETLAVVEAPVVVEAPAARVVSRDEFELMVRREAYQRAERRAFRNGTAFEDWIRAEAVVRDLLIADGALLA